jgi:hypothetical protein
MGGAPGAAICKQSFPQISADLLRQTVSEKQTLLQSVTERTSGTTIKSH